MLVPAKRNGNFFDDLMMAPFDAFFDIPAGSGSKAAPGVMRTDIKETEDAFQLVIDLPGVKKEDVTVEIENGYLEVVAETNAEEEHASEDGSYLRKERFSGKYSRKFFVGEDIVDDDITAKYENGTLQINVPKQIEPEPEAKKTISID